MQSAINAKIIVRDSFMNNPIHPFTFNIADTANAIINVEVQHNNVNKISL